MDNKTMKFCILIVSDTCSVDSTQDTTGQRLITIVRSKHLIENSEFVSSQIVPDDKDAIINYLINCTDFVQPHVILTTGGTGFSPRDVTPEATKEVIEKEAPGVVHAMTANSLKITPLAMLSRAVCGIRKKTLIVNLPGNQRAAEECFESIAKALPHAIALITGEIESVKLTHEEMQHPKTSKVNLKTVAFRDRKSPYPMIDVTEAQKIIKKVSKELNSSTMKVPLLAALYHSLAEDVCANVNVPPFHSSVKDGYAVIAADGIGPRSIVNAVAAGDMPTGKLQSGYAVRINTGAPIPEGADAVVQVEDTDLKVASSDGTEELEIIIKKPPVVGQDIRPIGSDLKFGEVILKKNTFLKAAELGVLAALGKSHVEVVKKPVIGILSTGNELQSTGEKLKPGHIYDSNKIGLLSLLKQYSFDAVDLGIVEDDPDAIYQVLQIVLNKCDILITSGGVSMGDRDLLKRVLKQDFNAVVYFGRVNMKPGKPTAFATVNWNKKEKLIFALPGNPVSAIVTAQLFVLCAIHRHYDHDFTVIKVKVASEIKLDPQRPEYHRAHLNKTGSEWIAQSTGDQRSSRLLSMLSSECLLILPPASKSKTSIKAGELVNAILVKS